MQSSTRTFSKSKLMAYRQCHRRLWLEIHRPTLREDSTGSQSNFDAGHQVGEIARRLYDPAGEGALIDPSTEGFGAAFARTTTLLSESRPIFEAGFSAGGALAFADVLLPVSKAEGQAWRMVEVKSSTSVKDYHLDDAAVQSFVARSAGVDLAGVSLAYIDNSWVYPGQGDYQGLLVETDLTAQSTARHAEVADWITGASAVASLSVEPAQLTGGHCSDPFACGFIGHCSSTEPKAEYPVNWLPRIQTKALKKFIEDERVTDLREVPDELLNDSQRRVKHHTVAGETYFDAAGAANDLALHPLPAYFLDFETINFAVPFWEGTRPFQQIPFQFSVHRLSRTGKLKHGFFLDTSGADPSQAFTKALVAQCGSRGPIFVYNAGFEGARIRELSEQFPRLRTALLAINDRLVDLWPIAKKRYYHPSQQGHWSIKNVLPAIAPDLSYGALVGVQDGGAAMDAFREAIAVSTLAERKAEIEVDLRAYCKLDTLALVRLWAFFTGRKDLSFLNL
jgi:hypothetical protein